MTMLAKKGDSKTKVEPKTATLPLRVNNSFSSSVKMSETESQMNVKREIR